MIIVILLSVLAALLIAIGVFLWGFKFGLDTTDEKRLAQIFVLKQENARLKMMISLGDMAKAFVEEEKK